MTFIKFDAKLKAGFFDKPAIDKAVSRAEKRAMSKALAFIRRSARSSLRKRKKTSKPGQTPSVHTSDRVATLKNILFAYDLERHSGVVGPVKLNGQSFEVTNAPAPSVMEHGGSVAVSEESYNGRKWYLAKRRKSSNGKKKVRRRHVFVKPRPFMLPALEKNSDVIADSWKGQVTG